MQKELKKKIVKRFLLWFISINVVGIGLNVLLYYFALPNQIEYVINNINNIGIMSLVVFMYIMMSILLYLAINLNYVAKMIR